MNPETGLSRKPALVVVLGIVLLCVVGFVYLFTSAGGRVPGQSDGYRVSFRTTDIKNTQPGGEVRIAGVKVGTVAEQSVDGDEAEVHLRIDDEFAPFHEGATVRIGVKSVIGQSFVEISDGDGGEIDEGATLSGDDVVPAVDVDEVISTFDAKTKQALSGTLTSLGQATEGRARQVDQLLQGAGSLGRDGYTAVHALRQQDEDLQELVVAANTILASLNAGRDDLGQLITNARSVTEATAGQDDKLASAIQKLPALLDSAERATGTLDGLGADLDPVAADLKAAAPDLSAALDDLPSVTRDLRALLPYMDASLGRADETLTQVPALAKNVTAISPELDSLMSDVSPMIEYMQPWVLDLGSFFGNFGASFDEPIENGVQPVSLAPIFNEYSVRNNPLDLTTLNPLHWVNPYPSPRGALDPKPYGGTYPKVQRDR